MSGWLIGFATLVAVCYALLIVGALWWLPYNPDDPRRPR